MSTPKATHCRYCQQPGDLYKGAHRRCKADAIRQFVRESRGVSPARYTHPTDRPTICQSCPAPRDTGSLWCTACLVARKKERTRKFMAKYRANLRKREVRAERYVPKPCACGCGGLVLNPKSKYASQDCWKKRPRATKPAPADKSKAKQRQFAVVNAAPVAFSGPVINNGVHIRRIPSMMPETLRNPATGYLWDLEG